MLSVYRRGFTLVELLITIAIIGVIATIVITAINPAEQIRRSRDSQVKTDIGVLGTELEANYTEQGGVTYANSLDDLTSLKTIPSPPAGWGPNSPDDGKYGYSRIGSPSPGSDIIAYSRLQSSAELGVAKANGYPSCNSVTTLYWRYVTLTNKPSHYCGTAPDQP